ncbi:MAG TPA: peptidoglycan-associated lipoprotein Pal [Candidatus Acidoferrales bacterium]|nr:peptidoglycan-associated lipoprotein Pal [Candidatus Acidoferrales bacterium]
MGKRLLCIAVLSLLVTVVGSGCSSKKGAKPGAGTSKIGEEGIDTSGSLEHMKKGQKPGTGEGGPLQDVHFGFDSFELDEQARGALRENAAWLKDNGSEKVEIEGHCDERGTVEYNLALGAKRARATKDYLATLGVSSDRLTTISYGEELPLCSEHTEDCWARNRRSHFVVLGD